MLVHAATYRGLHPVAVLHRRRLRHILQLLHGLSLKPKGRWADFGCSDGFILSAIQQGPLRGRDWTCTGFDRSEGLLQLARERRLPNTAFEPLDLNIPHGECEGRFDVVTCFETIEHTGDYRNALLNLVQACCPGGWIVVSVPNEVGLPGLGKFVGRRLARRNPYGDFFRGKSQLRYLLHLLADRDVEEFRQPPASGWGPHLGFDSRKLMGVIEDCYVRSGRCSLAVRETSPLAFSHFYVLQRIC